MPWNFRASISTSDVLPTPIGPSTATWRSVTSPSVGMAIGSDSNAKRYRVSTSAIPQSASVTDTKPLAVKNAASTRDRSPGFTIACW